MRVNSWLCSLAQASSSSSEARTASCSALTSCSREQRAKLLRSSSSICRRQSCPTRVNCSTSCSSNCTVLAKPPSTARSLFAGVGWFCAEALGPNFLGSTFLAGFMSECGLQSMSRVRQFGDLRNSRSSRQSSVGHFGQTATLGKTSAHGKGRYACVNCVNRSMSQQKALLRSSQRQQENSYILDIERREGEEGRSLEARVHRAEEEKRKVRTYNKEAMQSWEERRQRERAQKQQDRKLEQFNTNQYQRKIQQDRRREALLREKWCKDIDQQISLKQDRLNKEKQETRSPQPASKQSEREQLNAKKQEERLERYRNELLVQIKEEQARKERQKIEKSKELDITSCSILDRAEERARRAKQLDEDRRRQLEAEKRVHQQKLQQKRWEEQQKAEKEKLLERATKEREEQRLQQIEKRRSSQIQNYISQIKQQIDEREKSRRNNQMRQNTVVNEFFVKERPIESRPCDSCEKPFPKAYLTFIQDE